MTEPTPEYKVIDTILDNALHDPTLYTPHGWMPTPAVVRSLAAPLEAANKRIKELEREVGESKLETALDAQAVRTENTTLREAVRVLAEELIEWRRSSRSVADVAPQTQSNPTAKAAIEAARKEHNGRDE